MTNGIHSTVQSLHDRLIHRWCPKWLDAFPDHELGGFYERLGKGFQPMQVGQRRLVTQCRQLAMYSHYSYHYKKRLSDFLRRQYAFIREHYFVPETGLWRFSLDDSGNVKDAECDLYAMSFVIFALSHYYRATHDSLAKDDALAVLITVISKFRITGRSGFAEAVGPDLKPVERMRRQNPHMHLLEACLFARDVFGEPGDAYETVADEMVTLFQNFFYDPAKESLYEFFTDSLAPHPDKKDHLEPGHYFEWVWLLKKHAEMKGSPAMHDAVCMELLTWANKHGWDGLYGGIYDTVGADGHLVSDTKRIWPFCEALKANTLMLNAAPDRQEIKDRVTEMVRVFETKYMEERGFWTEWLNRNLTPAADYMPGTTPYHVYFGITEAWEILQKRGASKSFGGPLFSMLYGWRRALSRAYRFINGADRPHI